MAKRESMAVRVLSRDLTAFLPALREADVDHHEDADIEPERDLRDHVGALSRRWQPFHDALRLDHDGHGDDAAEDLGAPFEQQESRNRKLTGAQCDLHTSHEQDGPRADE